MDGAYGLTEAPLKPERLIRLPIQDLHFALRGYRRRKGLAVIAVLTLAVGLGATTAIFSVANALLLRPPPGIAQPDRVVEVGRTYEGRGFDTFSYPDFTALREQASPPFDRLAAFDWEVASFTQGGAGVRAWVQLVSPAYFDVLGVGTSLGRTFVADEAWPPGAHPVAVLDYAFWQDRLGGDPEVLGHTIWLNRRPFTVVGVLPAAFRGHTVAFTPDVYIPLAMSDVPRGTWDRRGSQWLSVLGRLAPGASVEEARTAARTVFDRLRAASPELYRRRSADVQPLVAASAALRDMVAMFMTVLAGLVGLVLLITCANVAGLLLARAADRERELAIRMALGSGRRRLAGQLLVEALALFLLGGVAGLLLAAWLTRLFAGIELPVPVPLDLDFRPDALVFGVGLGLALVTGVVFGLAPALRASKPDLVPALNEDTGTGGGRTGRPRRVFVATQVALSLSLLLAAGLFIRSLRQAGEMGKGFEPENVHVVALDLALEGYDAGEDVRFHETLLERLASVPSVTSAAVARDLPLDLSGLGVSYWVDGAWDGEGRPPYVGSAHNVVSHGYFETLRMPVLRGRVFTEHDDAGAEPVVVVSRELATRAWPDDEALGKGLRFSDDRDRAYTVIGVVEDTRNHYLTQPVAPMAYRVQGQAYRSEAYVVVRSAPGASGVPPAMRREILALDPQLALSPVFPLDDYTSVGLLPQRMAATLASALGVLALLLSALGIYGVVAYSVARRTREIGLRMALGARGPDVARLVLRSMAAWAVPGMLAGIPIGIGLGHLARSLLIGVSPVDPATLAAVAALLLAVALAASLVPARRAAVMHPMEALRSE